MNSNEIRKCFLALVKNEGINISESDIDIVKESPKNIQFEIDSCNELLVDIEEVITGLNSEEGLYVNILELIFRKNIKFMLLVYKLFISFELEYLETKGNNTDKYLIQLLSLLEIENMKPTYSQFEETESIERVEQTPEGTTPSELLEKLGIKPVE